MTPTGPDFPAPSRGHDGGPHRPYGPSEAGPAAQFPIDVTFPGEREPDDVDRWLAEHAMPFHLRA